MAAVIKLLLIDFICYPLNKHRVIEVAGKHYPLFKFMDKPTLERKQSY